MADLILYHGIVHTMTGQKAQAVAISGDRLEAVGSDEEILALASENCRKVDLCGRCLVPGFNDSHCHLVMTGVGYRRLNLRGVTSPEELIEEGRRYIAERQIPEGTWILGEGFDHTLFPDPVLPDRRVADEISTKHPVLIERVCGHVATLNSMAIERVGYNRDTVIPGGVIDRDDQGNLTGIVREAARDQIKLGLPKPGKEELKEAVRAAVAVANSHGVTSVQSDDLESGELETLLQVFHELEKEGNLHIRVFEEVQAARLPELNRFLQKGLRTGDGNDYFKIGNIKLLTDGSLGARTAYLREDYSDEPGNRGVAVYTQEALDEVVLAAHQAGMQVACHAIGDGAAEQVVSAYEKAYAMDGADLRNRIVHCQFADRELFHRMKKARVAVDIQPPFTASDYRLTASRMGERERNGYCWKTMLEEGLHLGGGSDSPVEPLDPIWGMHCAVNRTDWEDNPRGGWYPEQKLTAKQALKLYTVDGAYLSFEEDKKGRIQAGYLADLVVLSEDILAVPPGRIREIQVEMTIFGGKIVYTRV